MDFLRDPIWQFIGVLLTIVLAIAPIVYERLRRKKKSLQYVVLDGPTYMLTFHPGGRTLLTKPFPEKGTPSLRITYNDQFIEPEFYSVRLQLKNNGQLDITPEDFEIPMILGFEKDVSILDVSVEKISEPDFRVSIERSDNGISIKPTTCWKKGDWVRFKLLVACGDTAIPIVKQKPGEIQVKRSIIPGCLVRYIFYYLLLFLVVLLPPLLIQGINYLVLLPQPTWRRMEIVVFFVLVLIVSLPLIKKLLREWLQKSHRGGG